MKKALFILITLFFLNCGAQKKEVKTSIVGKNKTLKKLPNNTLASLEDIKTNLEYLASDELEGRNTGSKGIEKAAVYIEEVFKKNTIKPYFKTYRDSFNIKNIIGYNVVGYVEGTDPELKKQFVILGAHYDHIGKSREVNGDVIANGANDDASGTVAVMEWAKYFAKNKTNKRSLLFTLYAAEEMGLKGSEHLSKRLKNLGIDLYTMINFEMVGVPRSKEEKMTYITGYKLSNMAEKLNAYAGSEIIGFLLTAKAYSLFQRSDNYPFYKQFKVPAQAISTFDFTNFNYYHHVDDEADKIDFEHITNFVNTMIPAIKGMVNSMSKEIKMNNE